MNSIKPYWIASVVFALVAVSVFLRFIDPAPPGRIVISTGSGEGEYEEYAKLYSDILKDDGLVIERRQSGGTMENYERLKNPASDVQAGFVQDGVGSPDEAPDLVSLGSLYYEPIWIFQRGPTLSGKISDLAGKKIAIGRNGGGTQALSRKLLKEGGITDSNATLIAAGSTDAEKALLGGEVDVAFFLCTPQDPLISRLLHAPGIRLLNLDQAEGITRRLPTLHHLVLPHGAMDIAKNLPPVDVNLVAATVTLLIKDTLHPALTYSLLRAARDIHSEPGIFERKNEFPIDKDDQFPIADEAQSFYKGGLPFWQRFLPFWIATLIDRSILVLIPLLVVSFPIIRIIPKIYRWRIRQRIFRHYGELKFLETRILKSETPEKRAQHVSELDRIEERLNTLKIPIDYSDYLYALRGHIDYVRKRLEIRQNRTDPEPRSSV
ncbi:MAG: hypothetical protein EBX52_05355 [Proteobacteria bacterium]|nr:hypothetical protein [Pseudomonadota bacterium]